MKIMILGGNGFLGRNIYNSLKNKYEIILVDKIEGENVIQLDCSDYNKMEQIIIENKPDIVIHAAANKYVDRCESDVKGAINDNIMTTKVICQLQEKHAFKLVYISSDKVNQIKNIYSCTKYLSQKLVQKYNGITVQFVNLYGSSGSVIPIWTAKLLRGEKIEVRGKNTYRYMMNVEEAVNIIDKILSNPNQYLGKIIKPKNITKYNMLELAKTLTDESNIVISELLPFENADEKLCIDKNDILL